jgi:hypothetical protein
MTPLDAVTETHFVSRPDGQRMAALRSAVNYNLRRDLATQLRIAGRVLPGAVKRVPDVAAALRIGQRINPAVFTCHYQIATGLRRQDVGRVGSALGVLSRLLETSPYAGGFQIGPVMWDFTDAEILAFLCGPEGPRTSQGEYPEMWTPHDADPNHGVAWVEQSLPLLADLDPELHAEFETMVGSLRLFRGRAARGITSVRCFGLVLLRLPDLGQEVEEPLMYFLDHITHETSHLALHTLMNVDPLIINGHAGRFDAPIRPDPRPLYGIYHATFVLSRITRVLARLARQCPRPTVVTARDQQYSRFHKGLATLRQHATLTPLGDRVLTSCRELVDDEMG